MGIASVAKGFLRKTGTFTAAKDLYSALGGTVVWSETEWLHRLLGTGRDVFFIQIGANDGKTYDYIYPIARERGWRGVLVEPIGYLFSRLVENYRGAQGIEFENAALAEVAGKKGFYRLREIEDAALPLWYEGIGSLNKDTILSHRYLIPNIDDLLVEEEVECITFDELTNRHGVTKIDLILIDTEGYDLNILRTIDFRRFRPKLLIYEQLHLSLYDKAAAKDLLRSWGYAVLPMGLNNAAVRRR